MNDRAPEGTTFVCGACGKRSRTRYGFDDTGARCADAGWDASCMLHAVLCYDRKGDGGAWVAVPEASR